MYWLKRIRIVVTVCILMIVALITSLHAAPYKVLVVMSYEQENPWCQEIIEGIEAVFKSNSTATYFFMDTKENFEGGPEKAKAAYELYQKIKPDGVIAADDNAQSMFVLPYLKNKVRTPVMFCGVNERPEAYGYPAENVSGILERAHINESIALAKQLEPSIKTIAFLAKDSPSGRAILNQVVQESDKYLVDLVGFRLAKTIDEALDMVAQFKGKSDLLYVTATNGILDSKGRPLDNKQVTQFVSRAYGKPLIGSNKFHVEYGALCAVVKTGQDQGRTSAKMLLKAMQGEKIANIPITRNFNGSRVINVTVMEALEIKPKPIVLLGTKLVKTEK